jgi:hypothetical protein
MDMTFLNMSNSHSFLDDVEGTCRCAFFPFRFQHKLFNSLQITVSPSKSINLVQDGPESTMSAFSLSNNTGVLLLCEVAAKPVFEQVHANYNADQECRNNKKLCAALASWHLLTDHFPHGYVPLHPGPPWD